MKRRDFAVGLLLATVMPLARAQEPAKQHRIAIVEVGSVASIDDPNSRLWQPFWKELRRLGDVEGQNLVIGRYSGEGHLERYADLAREVAGYNPDVIVALTNPMTQALRAANGTTPIVMFGGSVIEPGLATSLARPGGNLTGVDGYPGDEIHGKRLQILKDIAPSAPKVALLGMRDSWLGGQLQALEEASRQLQISLIPMRLEESTASEYRRAFTEIANGRSDAIIVHARGELLPYRQLIVELAEKNHLPAIYPWREYVEAGGLVAYATDFSEMGRRMADDVHEILNGANAGDIPIYLPTKFDLVINLKAAKALGLSIPPALFGRADEVIE
jgi:putative tryptophan/tyrosine transport system substrate-binding protein